MHNIGALLNEFRDRLRMIAMELKGAIQARDVENRAKMAAIEKKTKLNRAPAAQARGYDAGKKIKMRKRHIAVDTDGRLLMVKLTTANVSDSAGAQHTLDAIRKRWLWVKHLFANGAYNRRKIMDKAAFKAFVVEFVVEIVRRIDADPRFKVLPRSWVVEKTPSAG